LNNEWEQGECQRHREASSVTAAGWSEHVFEQMHYDHSQDQSVTGVTHRREVVAYSRGPYCLMSYVFVLKLRKRGWKAHRLVEGYPEWKAAGLPVDLSAYIELR